MFQLLKMLLGVGIHIYILGGHLQHLLKQIIHIYCDIILELLEKCFYTNFNHKQFIDHFLI